ncbi:hypothetical protein [Rhabdothermincola sediminis]|uniref:hypothetical protein n=1 Tax=Rhabdothermincola sediminis TaxID=2751370 RepID=UPI001AA01776|nr:hypothetical protein [Rhabdothermincola sediminis]
MTSERLIRASWLGTGVFTVAAVVGTIWLEVVVVTVVVSVVLFALGTAAFLAAYLTAIGRSRYDAIGMGGLFFLAGSAPAAVRRAMLLSFAAEIVVAFVTASVRIYTPVAFGLLVPMYGLGVMGLWGARFGEFPAREAPAR